MTLLWLTLVAAALAAWVHMLNDFAPLDTYFPPTEVDAEVENYFSASYYDTHALFRSRAVHADKNSPQNVTVYSLPLPDYAHLDLTIDVVVVEGANDKAVPHISGTHGVEGFAGSAIQSSILANLGDEKVANLIHQRLSWCMHSIRFERLRALGSNGYDHIRDVLNSQTPVSWETSLDVWFGMLSTIVSKGFVAGKRAAVSGNYHYPTTVYFGGGGPPGQDSLVLSPGGGRDAAQRAQTICADRDVVVVGDQDGGLAEGFDAVSGLMCDGMSRFLPQHVTLDCAA
ncbi:hypothetical protein PRIC2_008792 [Phytophthora ramorum]